MSVLGDVLRAMRKCSPRRSRYNGSNYLLGFREGYAEAMGVAAAVADAWPNGQDHTERGERTVTRYEYGSAIRNADGTIGDEDFSMDCPATTDQVAAWNAEHAIGNDTDSTVVAVRRVIPEVEVYEPADSSSGGVL